jgi:hypothetical protein
VRLTTRLRKRRSPVRPAGSAGRASARRSCRMGRLAMEAPVRTGPVRHPVALMASRMPTKPASTAAGRTVRAVQMGRPARVATIAAARCVICRHTPAKRAQLTPIAGQMIMARVSASPTPGACAPVTTAACRPPSPVARSVRRPTVVWNSDRGTSNASRCADLRKRSHATGVCRAVIATRAWGGRQRTPFVASVA